MPDVRPVPTRQRGVGTGLGSGTGPVANIAADLATWINLAVPNVEATSVGDTVYMATNRVGERFPVQATNDMSVLLGGTIFAVVDSTGTVLNTALKRRASFFIPKVVKSQAAPTILP